MTYVPWGSKRVTTGGFRGRGSGRDVRPPKKNPNIINTKKMEKKEDRERERREVQSLRLKLS